MIRLIRPYIDFDDVKDDFKEVFDSGWFTKGKNVSRFTEDISNYTGSKHSILTTSATTALSSCLKILDIKKGDEVIVSDFSFPASANVIEDIGAIPVFADIDPNTFNMTCEELEKNITDKTRAVMFVDALGNPTGIHNIKEICRKYKLPLIEDAACAIGSSENGKRCGNISDLTCFSFHPRKLLTTGEGGAITTNNSDLFERLKVKLEHGCMKIDDKMCFVDYGYNYRMSELQCVMGIKQIQKLDEIVKERNIIRDDYIKELSSLGFKEQKTGKDVVYNVQSLVFLVPEDVNRDELIKFLYENDIETTIGTYSLSNTHYYKEKYKDPLKTSLFIEKNTITFPCYRGVPVNRISSLIKEFMR